MNQIDLTPFCGTDETREYLMRPFNIGDFTFATDARIVLRVARRDGLADLPKEKSETAERLGKYFAAVPTEYQPLPAIPPGNECTTCGGKGMTDSIVCGDCGSLISLNGQKIVCLDCINGRVFHEVRVPFGGHDINSHYLRLIHTLPNCRIAVVPNPVEAESSFFGFTFDGGQGRLMPMTSVILPCMGL
jgi:hypothetical protein